MTPADRPQLLHQIRVAVTTAAHVLARKDAQSVADALEQITVALEALERLRAMEAAEGN